MEEFVGFDRLQVFHGFPESAVEAFYHAIGLRMIWAINRCSMLFALQSRLNGCVLAGLSLALFFKHRKAIREGAIVVGDDGVDCFRETLYERLPSSR